MNYAKKYLPTSRKNYQQKSIFVFSKIWLAILLSVFYKCALSLYVDWLTYKLQKNLLHTSVVKHISPSYACHVGGKFNLNPVIDPKKNNLQDAKTLSFLFPNWKLQIKWKSFSSKLFSQTVWLVIIPPLTFFHRLISVSFELDKQCLLRLTVYIHVICQKIWHRSSLGWIILISID